MFRNIRYYHVDGDWPDSEEDLSTKLEKAAFKECGPLTERSSGWVSVTPEAGDSLARRVNGADLLRLRSQSRVLPHAAINEALEKRIDEFQERMGEAPGAREKRRLKAEVRDELTPKAMLKSDRIWGYYDSTLKLLAIDAAQETAAERFLRKLRVANDALNLRPLQFREPLNKLLTGVFLGGAPAQFAVGRECRMQDAADSASRVRWSNFDLSDSSIRNHVADGMHLTHLSIIYDNILNFVLDENGVFTKLKFLGADDDGDHHEDPLARLDAEFVLLTGTMRHLLGDLRKFLGE